VSAIRATTVRALPPRKPRHMMIAQQRATLCLLRYVFAAHHRPAKKVSRRLPNAIRDTDTRRESR